MSLFLNSGTPDAQALRALTSRLYVRGGGLKPVLERIARGEVTGTVVLLTDDSQMHYGVCVVAHNGDTMVYVVPELRGRGWGSKLVTMARSLTNIERKSLRVYPGDDLVRSIKFWKRNGFDCQDFGVCVPMTFDEAMQLTEGKHLLYVRSFDEVEATVIESLYINQVYSSEYSDQHESIQGQLASFIDEELQSFDYVMAHLSGTFVSCATLRSRPHHAFQEGTKNIVELQMFVQEPHRRKGFGQQFIDKARVLYPDRALFGYFTDSSRSLFERNGILDLRSIS